jgi:hypothetical protein
MPRDVAAQPLELALLQRAQEDRAGIGLLELARLGGHRAGTATLALRSPTFGLLTI